MIAVPTTAGTGSEVTRNAVLHSAAHQVKVSLRSPLLLPTAALVDPEMTVPVPPSITATTGMDALTQLIEPFLSSRANPISDGFCREGLPRVMASLERAWENGEDLGARSDMALGGLLSGLALANSGLGAVHGIAAPLGGMFQVAHGAVCAALLPAVLRCNLARIRADANASCFLERYVELSRMASHGGEDDPDFIVHWAADLKARLKIGGLRQLGVNPGRTAEVAAKAAQASSMKGNPVALELADLEKVLARAMD